MPTVDRHEQKLAKKWEALKKRGLTRPKNGEENLKRLREAHRG